MILSDECNLPIQEVTETNARKIIMASVSQFSDLYL